MNVDRYEIRERLGQGTRGVVYLAHDPKLGREVAVKVLAAAAGDDARRESFASDARALATMHHPNIVEVFDFGTAEGRFYLVTEYVPGLDFGRLAQQNGVFPEAALVAAGLEVCSALAHAHGRGLIHRALKPENVLLARGHLVLTDFGIVRALAGKSAAVPGRRRVAAAAPEMAPFSSPEQHEHRPLDAQSDLFSVGALLYFLATRRLPYDAESGRALLTQMRRGRVEALERLRPDLSLGLRSVVHRCLDPLPERRPASADAMKQDLQRVLTRHGHGDAREILSLYEKDPKLTGFSWTRVPGPESGEHRALVARKGRRRSWWWLAGIALAAAVLAVAAVWLARG